MAVVDQRYDEPVVNHWAKTRLGGLVNSFVDPTVQYIVHVWYVVQCTQVHVHTGTSLFFVHINM